MENTASSLHLGKHRFVLTVEIDEEARRGLHLIGCNSREDLQNHHQDVVVDWLEKMREGGREEMKKDTVAKIENKIGSLQKWIDLLNEERNNILRGKK